MAKLGRMRSSHPTHRTFVRTDDDARKVDFTPCCSCQAAPVGDTVRLSAGVRPRDREAAFRQAIAKLRVHERQHGIADEPVTVDVGCRPGG